MFSVPYRYLIVILVKVASCSCVHSFVDAYVSIWNETFSRDREGQPTDFLWRRACLLWLVKFAQLLSKCPSQTKLC